VTTRAAVLQTAPLPLAIRSIDHSAIAHNVRVLLAASGRPVMAVVKADAFGHGAREVAETALAAGATWLGVATVAEAVQLREGGLRCPIFAWLVDPWTDLELAVANGVTLSCANVETLDAIAAAAGRTGIVARVHLELDTGMARGGAAPAQWPSLCIAARAAETTGAVAVEGLWSHLALASVPDPRSVAHPLAVLQAADSLARAAGLRPTHRHIANSAAALAHPDTALSLVRAGAAVYGIETVEGAAHGLRPAMRVTSRVTQLREVAPGTGVGYHHAYRVPVRSHIALVPVGYGDGVPRALSDGGRVVIGGASYPVRGLISMDQLMVEVDSRVRLGDEVVLIGAGPGEPTVLEWAALAGTIPHEVLTGFGARVALDHVRQ